MNNRTSLFLVTGLIILAIIGFVSGILYNPAGVLQMIAMAAIVGAIIYFLVRRFSGSSPGKQQHRAFQKAAKRSKKRFQAKEATASGKKSKIKSLASARKKKDASHLTVIDGKKGKKKNRASF